MQKSFPSTQTRKGTTLRFFTLLTHPFSILVVLFYLSDICLSNLKYKKSLLKQSIVLLLFGQVQHKRLRFCHKELTLLLHVLLYTVHVVVYC
jgi:hypothetical protein